MDALLGRLRELSEECIQTYAGIGKQAVDAISGDEDTRSTFYRDAWMAWAGLGGKVIEALYITAAIADHATQRTQKSEPDG